jgi:hypothetical protein
MTKHGRVRRWIGVALVVGAVCLAMALRSLPGNAQPFATNTPNAPISGGDTPAPTVAPIPTLPPFPTFSFAPNTPVPEALSPDAPPEQYALRLWTEEALFRLLLDSIRALRPSADDAARAVRLLQRELAHRYPNSRLTDADRADLLAAMRAAPPGAVDMREAVRGYAETTLNIVRPAFNATARFEADGFRFELTAVDFDGRAGLDVLLRVVDAGFDGYYVALGSTDGSYALLPSDLPAAPFDADEVRIERLGDLTGDIGAEIVVGLRDGSLNGELRIFGVRGSAAAASVVNLAAPGQSFRYSTLEAAPDLRGVRVRLESALWLCYSVESVAWSYVRNSFIQNSDGSFVPRAGLACALASAEPLFALPPDEAFAAVQRILGESPQLTPDDQRAGDRAQLALALLADLAGRRADALSLARPLVTSADAWLGRQAAQYIRSANQGEASPLVACGVLARIEIPTDTPTPDQPGRGICDPDAALARAFADDPLSRDQDIVTQLTERGLTVVDVRTVREIGRLDRQVVAIDFGGALRYWGFAPLQSDRYTAEPAPPPTSAEALPPPTPLTAPDGVYALLFSGALTPDVLRQALTQLDNLERLAGSPRLPEWGFVRAFINDLLNNRALAAAGYYQVWAGSPASVWGQLAAAHLERR